MIATASGCATSTHSYSEKHEIANLRVVFMDEQTLLEKYTQISGVPSMTLSGNGPAPSIRSVRGFFDFHTNTIYCAKMDFEACGHELHHATLGRFHAD
jgi:hypothetical protein